MDRPRILIADDTLVAEVLKDLIEPDYQVIKSRSRRKNAARRCGGDET